MLSGLRFVAAALAGIFAGAVTLSLLTVLVYALVAPDALRDGQFVFVFFITIPFGGFWGGNVGVGLSLLRAASTQSAAWVLMTGGAVPLLLLLSLTWILVQLSGGNFWDVMRLLALPEIGTPVAVSLLTLLYGRGLLTS